LDKADASFEGSKTGYKLVQGQDVNRPWDPDADTPTVLEGVSDIHIHSTGGRIDVFALARQATRAGMKAIVLKNQYFPTTEAARLANEMITEWANRQEAALKPVKVYAGIVLNNFVGGLNPEAVRIALTFGAKKVWFPTYSSAAHVVRNTGIDKERAIKQKDLSYVLEEDHLIPSATEIIHLLSEYDAALSVGHAFLEEIWAILEEGNKAGVPVIVDHPHMGSQDIAVYDQAKLANSGAFLNHMAANFIGLWGGLDAFKLASDIREVGANHCIMSTDLGQVTNPAPTESLRAFIHQMQSCGLDEKEIQIMTKTNPTKVLKLND